MMTPRLMVRASCLILACGLAGCSRPAEPVLPAPEDVRASQATPVDAARTVLSCLRSEQRAIAHGDKAAIDRFRQELRELIWREEIRAALVKQAGKFDTDENQLVEEYARNWGRITAYYVEGLQLDKLQAPPEAAQGERVTVLAPAVHGEKKTMLRVECIRAADGRWFVASVGFAYRTAATTRPG